MLPRPDPTRAIAPARRSEAGADRGAPASRVLRSGAGLVTAHAVGYDLLRMREIIAAAKDRFGGSAPPPQQDLDQFLPLLERCIRTLLPYAHGRADQLAVDSRAGEECRRAIERARHLRTSGPGGDLASATAHAHNLATCLDKLLELAEHTRGPR